jgi:hypothetical protein
LMVNDGKPIAPTPTPTILGTHRMPFLAYGLLLPYYRKDIHHSRYALMRADDWSHFDTHHDWSLSGL